LKLSIRYVLFIFLFVTCIASYYSSIHHDFTQLDDQVQVVNNEAIRKINFVNLKAIFSSTSVGMYQPLTTSFYAIIYTIFGKEAIGFHWAALILHLMNGFLVFKLLHKLKQKWDLSYFLCALFLLHPLQVESVAWVSAFSNICFSFFYLLGLIQYVNFKEQMHKKHYYFSLLFFVLSLLAKPSAVTLPLLLIALDFFYDSRFSLKLFIQKIPFFLLSILFGLVTLQTRETAGHLSDLSQSFGFLDRIVLIAYSILFYPFKFILPVNLSAFYPYPTLTNNHLPYLYYFTVPLVLLITYLLYRFRSNKLLILGALFYSLSISVTLQIVAVGNQLTTDRYIYLPMIGLLIMAASLIRAKPKIIWISTAILGFTLATKTTLRSQVWKNDQFIWEDVLQKYPDVAQAHNNLGSYLLEKKGQSQSAFKHFNKAIELKPYYADAYSNRGNLFSQMGNSEKAIADFNQAIQLRPHADAFFNRANEKAKLGQFNDAIADYTASIQLKASPDAYTNRAFAYLRSAKIQKAQQDLDFVINQFPNFAQAYFLKGMIAQQNQQSNQACFLFKQAAGKGHEKAKQALKQLCN
tara:strand:+ start:7461 stop:9194 length:1734 start_codon:yes stop_codon:yes gene_type:complete